MVLEKALESPLDCKEIQPVNPKGNKSWIFIGRTDDETETTILWPPDAKNWLIGKDPDVGKNCRWKEEGTTEDEMVGWHHWLDGHEFEHTLGVVDGQGSQACCSPMGLQRVRHDWATELYRTDTSSIWATILVFYVLGFLRANCGEWLQSDGCWMAGFLSFLSFLRTYQLMVHDCLWLLMTVTSFDYWYNRKYSIYQGSS